MIRKLGETIVLHITTHSPTTGAAANASAISVSVYEQASSTPMDGLTAEPVNIATGHYRHTLAVTAGNGFVVGRTYNVVATATVAGVTARTVLATIMIRAASIDDVAAKTALIHSGGVTVSSPVSATGRQLTIVRGDTYSVAAGQALEWTDSGGMWPDLDEADIEFTVRDRLTDAEVIAVDAELVDTAPQVVRVELDSADTNDLVVGPKVCVFDLQATLPGGEIVTLVLGELSVVRDVTRPVPVPEDE